MMPQQWASPCGNQCTHKYAALTQIPWRVFCKKGCTSDGETWEECLEECNQICYKDPVLKDKQWSAYIDRSPGAASYSEECFHACVSGCGYKFVQTGHQSLPLFRSRGHNRWNQFTRRRICLALLHSENNLILQKRRTFNHSL
ncbi:uncharacterized protein LOC133317734 isoform X1 [Gastrolobium bilobum]|uniref:uncharacterized protein LOC133317734 isoform X1 n=1 Tax=Gastrolobium bilobum TaxID=150636 RepID=UPI002AAFA48C|nr:uncharacterized protein LOC133317734 isoform X1 [Gastrolobium bilobum]